MPTPEYFARYPPFPTDIPVADLTHLSLRKLLENDKVESQKLFEAGKTDGLFLLDLKGCDMGEVMIKHTENAFVLNEKLFALGQEELRKHPVTMPTNRFGYKFDSEFAKQVDEPDAIDIYTLSQDHVLGLTPSRSNPELVDNYRPLVKEFIHQGYDIISVLLSHLDSSLALPIGTLASLCPLDKPSGTGIRLLRTSPDKVGTERTRLFSHTDIGAITMLFNVVGGLQTLPAGSKNISENWRYIKPLPGHVIINLGDAIVQWTGGVLRANMHRVTTPPGVQATCTRFSVGYLVRPAADASMQRLRSSVIPPLMEGEEPETRCAREWDASKAKNVVSKKAQPTNTETSLSTSTTEISV